MGIHQVHYTKHNIIQYQTLQRGFYLTTTSLELALYKVLHFPARQLLTGTSVQLLSFNDFRFIFFYFLDNDKFTWNLKNTSLFFQLLDYKKFLINFKTFLLQKENKLWLLNRTRKTFQVLCAVTW